jgi:hypothetical protein
VNAPAMTTVFIVGETGLELIFGSLISLAQEANNSPRAIIKTDNIMFFMLVSLEEYSTF